MKWTRLVKAASRPVGIDELIDLINQYKTKTIRIKMKGSKYFTLKVKYCSKEREDSIRIRDIRGYTVFTYEDQSFVIENGDTLTLIFEDFAIYQDVK